MKKVAILTDNGFKESDITSPKKAMEDAGIKVDIVSFQKYKVKAWKNDNWSIALPVDPYLPDAHPGDYDAMLIPGGVINPGKMRANKDCVNFVKQFMLSGKPVAAICHGPQLLIETGMLDGRHLTSDPSIKTDLINAGATWWENKKVIADDGLITTQSSEDLKQFNEMFLEEIMENMHAYA